MFPDVDTEEGYGAREGVLVGGSENLQDLVGLTPGEPSPSRTLNTSGFGLETSLECLE